MRPRHSLGRVIASILGKSGPRARVSWSALERNIAAAHAAAPGSAIDLRRDACGHGAELVADIARAAGVSEALVDDGGDRFGLELARAEALPLEAVYGLGGRGVPALSFVGPVLQTKPLRAGDGVSYGYIHRAPQDTRAALVSGGYAQGVVRAIGSHASVRIGGRACPIIGRVAMDVCVVDIGDADIAVGDEAVFFGGEDPSQLATWAGATAWTELELVGVVGLSAPREVAA